MIQIKQPSIQVNKLCIIFVCLWKCHLTEPGQQHCLVAGLNISEMLVSEIAESDADCPRKQQHFASTQTVQCEHEGLVKGIFVTSS